MDLTEIRKLVRLMQQADLTELEIDDTTNGLRVHLKRALDEGGDAVRAMTPVVQVVPGAAAPAAVAAVAPIAGAPVAEGLPPGTIAFESPMVGTFYRSPAPDADPYVERGSKVDEDSVLCIVEAMKVMNEIKGEIRGEIVELLVENGEPVEFGQPLFLIKKS
jgi:acetyl-CoA carboxylase biotin carboxyl carrier protein